MNNNDRITAVPVAQLYHEFEDETKSLNFGFIRGFLRASVFLCGFFCYFF